MFFDKKQKVILIFSHDVSQLYESFAPEYIYIYYIYIYIFIIYIYIYIYMIVKEKNIFKNISA